VGGTFKGHTIAYETIKKRGEGRGVGVVEKEKYNATQKLSSYK